MTVQNTTIAAHFNPLPSLRAIGKRIFDFIAETSTIMACSREAERLLQMTDEELAARGLTRDRVVHHVFARYMSY